MNPKTTAEVIANVNSSLLNCIESLAASPTSATLDNCLPRLASAAEQLRNIQVPCSPESPSSGHDLRLNMALLKTLLHHAAEFYLHRARQHGNFPGGYSAERFPPGDMWAEPTFIVES